MQLTLSITENYPQGVHHRIQIRDLLINLTSFLPLYQTPPCTTNLFVGFHRIPINAGIHASLASVSWVVL